MAYIKGSEASLLRATMTPFTRSTPVAFLLIVSNPTQAFVTPTQSRRLRCLKAAPKRLEENVDGVLYVNEKCINCSACSHFAPDVFERSPTDAYHAVYHQPDSPAQVEHARAALAACPVAAIRVESQASQRHDNKQLLSKQDVQLAQSLALSPKLNGLNMPFPREIIPNNIYFVGHHNEASFGATPYLTRVEYNNNPEIWILVDSPKHSKLSKNAIVSLTGTNGPDYMLLTHVDDVAGHGQWKEEFPNMKRVFHAGDLGQYNWIGDSTLENVEVLLPNLDQNENGLTMYSLDGKVLNEKTAQEETVVILHTPGHSPGSISLYQKPHEQQPGVLFTGDTYAYSTRTNSMNAFPRYGNNLRQQAKTLQELLTYDWDWVLPGHGHTMDYTNVANKDDVKQKDVQQAIEHMKTTRKW